MTDEYKDFREEGNSAGHNALAHLHGLVNEQHELELEVARLQQQLQLKQDQLKLHQEKILPEAMLELGLSTFGTPSGLQVSLEESIHASIPKKFQDDAFTWLDENNESGMIKRSFEIKFNKDEEKLANKFVADLNKRKTRLRVDMKKKVEPMTLKAWVTRSLEEGREIPLELFGVFRRKVSRVKVG